MRSFAFKPLLSCLLGVAVIAGCATPPPAQQSASTTTPTNVQQGKVAGVVHSAVAQDPSAASSSGAGMSGASGASGSATAAGIQPAFVTVQFNDGTQRSYLVDQKATDTDAFAVGDAVMVITDDKGITIVSP